MCVCVCVCVLRFLLYKEVYTGKNMANSTRVMKISTKPSGDN